MAEFWRGQRSLRQLRVLIENLPPGGAVSRAMTGSFWTDQQYLLANIVDAVQYGTYSVTGALGGKPRKPDPQPRPNDKRGKSTGDRGTAEVADVVTYLDSLTPTAIAG